jgi:RNA polymerase sigma-70 factor (ECF subfamily)
MLWRKPPMHAEAGRVSRVAPVADTDADVLSGLRAGNEEAFATVFARYHRLVYATALRFLRDEGEAEDLTQSVFLEVFQKVGQFDPARGTLKMWLLQFAYSRSINRRNYLMVRRLHVQGPQNEALDDNALWMSGREPFQAASRPTGQLLAQLPEAQRETIEMVFFEDLTFTEIAERRGETFSAVRHHYYRGLIHLRGLLGETEVTTTSRRAKGVLHEVKRVRT